jgi:hypothetical protein
LSEVFVRFLLVTLMLSILGACSAPSANDLVGTWDYVFEEPQAEVVVAEFSADGLIESADEVVVRLGFDEDDKFWLGYVFDGELILVGGHPKGAEGTFRVEDDLLIADQGQFETVERWSLEGVSLTMTWVSACDKTGTEPVCTESRNEFTFFPPGATASTDLPVITFTKSSDDPSY